MPWVINATHCPGSHLELNFALPHPSGWREADSYLSVEEKNNIIMAYKRIHNAGVLHGDVELRHMLIGDDKKWVTSLLQRKGELNRLHIILE